jgi:hypothetical protein
MTRPGESATLAARSDQSGVERGFAKRACVADSTELLDV